MFLNLFLLPFYRGYRIFIDEVGLGGLFTEKSNAHLEGIFMNNNSAVLLFPTRMVVLSYILLNA